MPMRALRVWLGPIVGLIVIAALVLLLKGGPQPANTATASASATVNVLTVDPTAVTQIDIAAAGKTLTLVQKPAPATGTASAAGSTWAIGSATGKAADPTKVQNLISLLDPLQATRSLGVVSNPTDYGLGKPSTVLKVTEKGGTVLTLDIGARTPVGGDYATTGGGKVYIISSSVQQALVTDPAQWVPTATSTATSTGG